MKLKIISVFVLGMVLSSFSYAETVGFSLEAGQALNPRGIDIAVIDDHTSEALTDAVITTTDTKPRTITVSHPGYATLTLVGVNSERVTIYLKPLPTTDAQVMASGTMSDYIDVPKSHLIGGFAVRNLSAMDLLDFDTRSLISPINDTINVFGPRQIPSNFMLPDQHPGFLIGMVHINKPVYRLPMAPKRKVRLVGIQAQVKIADFLPGLSNRSSISSLNKLKFDRVTWTDEITPEADFEMNLSNFRDLVPTYNVTVTQPPFKADVYVLAVSDLFGDSQVMIPTDVRGAYDSSKSDPIVPISVLGPSEKIGVSSHIVALAASPDGLQFSGIISSDDASELSPGAFSEVLPMADKQPLPETMLVQAPANGLSMVDIIADDDSHHMKNTHRVIVLPGAGVTTVPLAKFASETLYGAKVHQYQLGHLEFAPGFNPDQIDGAKCVMGLQRFSWSTARVQ